MQRFDQQTDQPGDDFGGTFAERAKAARLRVGLTQQQLSDRLSRETPVELDTSAITRIEAGQREPRLSEALAISRILGFGLDNLVPRADLQFYLNDVDRLMKQGRAALVQMIRSVDPAFDFVRRNPDCLGDDRLEDRISAVIDRFRQDVAEENVAVTRGRSDQRLKRQLLRAVSEGILVGVDELPPVHEKWFKDDIGLERPGAGRRGGRRQGWRR